MKHAQSNLDASTKVQEVIVPGLLRVETHDEWLLDEALEETFPASDSIAVSPSVPASTKAPTRAKDA